MAKDEPARIAGVRVTHPERVLYEEQGITKRDLAEYYVAVRERVVPQLRGRPLTMVRCPQGPEGTCFYQRRAMEGFPDAVRRVEIPDDDGPMTYLVADTLAAVVSLVQMGVLELHTWGARRDRLDRPDRMVLDLDPDPSVPWSRVVDAAFELRERVAELGLTAFVKTTGGKGLHLVVPLVRRHGWDDVRELSRALAEEAEARAPERYLARASREERTGRIFVDYLRNAWSATAVAAYSTRARPGAPVSTPLTWEELRAGIDPAELNVRTVPERVRRQTADPWAGYDAARVALSAKMREAVGR